MERRGGCQYKWNPANDRFLRSFLFACLFVCLVGWLVVCLLADTTPTGKNENRNAFARLNTKNGHTWHNAKTKKRPKMCCTVGYATSSMVGACQHGCIDCQRIAVDTAGTFARGFKHCFDHAFKHDFKHGLRTKSARRNSKCGVSPAVAPA